MLEERLHRWMPLPSEQRCGRDGRHRKVERGTHPRLFVGEGNWLGYSGVDPCVGVRVSTRCIGVRRYGGGTAQGSLHKLLYYSILFSETAPVSRAPAPPRALPYLVPGTQLRCPPPGLPAVGAAPRRARPHRPPGHARRQSMAEEQRVEALALQKKELQDEADELEKQIFNLERKYLEDTREYGNVVVGWSQLTGAKPARDRLKVSTQNFLFSLSSVTSPASGSGSAGSGKRGGAGATSKRPPKKGKKEASSPAGPAAPLTAGSDNQVTEARDGGSSGTPRKGRGKSGGAGAGVAGDGAA